MLCWTTTLYSIVYIAYNLLKMAFPGPTDPLVLANSVSTMVFLGVDKAQTTMMMIMNTITKFIIANIYAILLIIVMVIVAFAEMIWYTLKWFFGEAVPWFFVKFIPWLFNLFMCGVNGIINLPQCFIWYMLDIAGRIIYLPFRLTFWFLEYLTEIELTKIEKDIWCFLEDIDKYIHSPEPEGLGTGIHIIHFPDSVMSKCYTCKTKFPKPPEYKKQKAFSTINRIKKAFS
jgi:hypothetical protein